MRLAGKCSNCRSPIMPLLAILSSTPIAACQMMTLAAALCIAYWTSIGFEDAKNLARKARICEEHIPPISSFGSKANVLEGLRGCLSRLWGAFVSAFLTERAQAACSTRACGFHGEAGALRCPPLLQCQWSKSGCEKSWLR